MKTEHEKQLIEYALEVLKAKKDPTPQEKCLLLHAGECGACISGTFIPC